MGELADTVKEAVERSQEGDEGDEGGERGKEGGRPERPGHGRPPTLNAIVAISVAITATFIAIVHVKDENTAEEMQHVESESVDNWAYYQAKGTKMNVAESAMDGLVIQRDVMPGLTREGHALLDRKIAEYGEKIHHYEAEKTEIKRTATELQERYERFKRRDDQFDMSEATASIAIALLGITALTQKRGLLFVAWGFAGLGILLGLAGFLNLSFHPDFLARLLG
jgi:hypothetical protein